MRWIEKLNEGIKHSVRSWLNITPASAQSFQINEMMDFEGHAIRNRIWFRGDGSELEQFYQQNHEYADRYKFWASKSTKGMEIRKIHTGLPALTVKVLCSIIMPDMNDFEFEDLKQEELWSQIAEANDFPEKVDGALQDALCVGDGAFKVSIDTQYSPFPILEWYSGERVEFVWTKNRIDEVIFKTPYKGNGKTYVLNERYGHGYIVNELYQDNKMVDLGTLEATKGLQQIQFDEEVMLAVPFMIYRSSRYEGRGGSIFDGKIDNYDALDEIWSQWMDAMRAGRAKTYIPDNLIPKDPSTGAIMKPNPFDNRFIATGTDMTEGAQNKISTEQPGIPHESYGAAYITALDLCLQGVISPSTLGIDTKKLDNADAQREKEKTTLYTRNKIVEALQHVLPDVVNACINADHLIHDLPTEKVESNIQFGEYANPSFESQVETVVKAKQGGIMSIERSVEELYGDTLDEHCKQEEIARLKAEQGIQELEEPGINMSAGEFQVEIGGGDEGKNSEPNMGNEPGGVPGSSEGGEGAGSNGDLRS